MPAERLSRDRYLPPVLGVLLFVVTFVVTFALTLPREVILSAGETLLARQGISIVGEDARIVPWGVRFRNAAVRSPIGSRLDLDVIDARYEFLGLFRRLPFHLRLSRGRMSVDLRTSPKFQDPSKGSLEVRNLSTEDLGALLPTADRAGFAIDRFRVRWRGGDGKSTGDGDAALSYLRFPVPSPDSPIREAVLRDVRMKFTVRSGTLRISSLTGTYEGSQVEGTGEIARVLSPSAATITFHLRIRNPMEGQVAALFNLVAKNVKNANLRITGPLLAPSGEFQFF